MKLPKINPEVARRVIFGIVRVAGPAVTAYLGIRAGEKVQQYKVEMIYKQGEPDLMPEEDEEMPSEALYFDELSWKEKFKFLAPVLAPVAISAGVTTVCAVIDKRTDLKRIEEITGLLGLSMLSEQKYRQALQESDPEKCKELDEQKGKAIAEAQKIETTDILERSRYGGTTIFVDTLTGREFTSTLEHVQAAIQRANEQYEDDTWYRKLVDNGGVKEMGPVYHPNRYLGLNDFYDYLGIRGSWFGQTWGYVGEYDKDTGTWDYCGEHIDIHVAPDDEDPNRYYLVYGPETYPMEGWYEI